MHLRNLEQNFKQFLKLVHPDFFYNQPLLRQVNEKSLQHLNSIFDALKDNKQLPTNLDLKLYLKPGMETNSPAFKTFRISTGNKQEYLLELGRLLDIKTTGVESQVVHERIKKVNFGQLYRKSLF